jgi:uncharacterized RDD family membrane protein YckC
MTQPPDDLERRPDGSVPDDATTPDDPTAPENQPTVAWTPPDPTPSEPSSADVPTPDAPSPDAPPPAPSWDAPAPTPPPATPSWETPATPPPASPIISASPSVPPDVAPGWQQPPPPVAPVVAWETPGGSPAAPGREGYVIAGMGARLVAYFIDAVLVTIVPTILGLLVVDYGSIFQQIIDASRANAEGQFTRTNVVIEVTPEVILVALIAFAIQFIYFVGFWTSGARATPGMRGLKMQVVDAATGGTLSLTAATKRFVAMGSALALLIVVPTLQSVASIAPFAVSLFLFFTAITNDRRQGLHDKWASSLVIRSTSSGDGATVIGCLLLIVLVVGLSIVAAAAFFAAVGPQVEELMREIGNSV